MTGEELLGFTYRFEPGAPGGRTLLLLHGTGADENDLLPLGRMLDDKAHLLSPRGKVLEGGMPRFFRRFAEGVLDIDDLKKRTHELVDFIDAAAERHGFGRSRVVAVGYSNGANIAASTLLLRPDALDAAVLLRPMFPFEPEERPRLDGVDVFIASGRRDPLIEPGDADALARLLGDCGANVEHSWSDRGHPLGSDEVARAAEWVAARR
ncbi:MAG TPA: alpha/beta hydrolase [Actinomycetota bacterium]|nr:alpha/beta hydrolase [Actinomycetota bacterium]